MTSTGSQASLHLPISLAFNGLEGGSLIFMLSLSIRQGFFKSFVSKFSKAGSSRLCFNFPFFIYLSIF